MRSVAAHPARVPQTHTRGEAAGDASVGTGRTRDYRPAVQVSHSQPYLYLFLLLLRTINTKKNYFPALLKKAFNLCKFY